MEELEKKLDYRFHSRELLAEALNHSSYANEHRSAGLRSNERLEFPPAPGRAGGRSDPHPGGAGVRAEPL